jgi:hypothetical protein
MTLQKAIGFPQYKKLSDAQREKIRKLDTELSVLKAKYENDEIESSISRKRDRQIPRWERNYAKSLGSLQRLAPEEINKFL